MLNNSRFLHVFGFGEVPGLGVQETECSRLEGPGALAPRDEVSGSSVQQTECSRVEGPVALAPRDEV